MLKVENATPLTPDRKICAINRDLLDIDTEVRNHLKMEAPSKEKLCKELDLYIKITIKSQDLTDKSLAEKKVKMIRKRLQDAERAQNYVAYLIETRPIIEEYKNLSSEIKPAYFGYKPVISESSKKRMKELRKEYAVISKKYVDIEYEKLEECICDCTVDYISVDGLLVCPECGIQETQIQDTPCFKDINRINLAAKSSYSSKQNLHNAKLRCQAKNNMQISKAIYDKILEDAKINGIDIENITKGDIHSILKRNKLGMYYAGIAIIHFNLTGQEPIEISHLYKDIDEIDDEVEKVYFEVTTNNNSLNVWFKLYKILQLLDFNPRSEDFLYFISEKSLAKYKHIWRDIVKNKSSEEPYKKSPNGNPLWRLFDN